LSGNAVLGANVGTNKVYIVPSGSLAATPITGITTDNALIFSVAIASIHSRSFARPSNSKGM
jgi:hypothetical protein